MYFDRHALGQHKIYLLFALFFVFAAMTATVVYIPYAHGIIEKIYKGESIGFLNALITGQAIYPMEVYWATGDAMLYAFASMAIFLALILILWSFRHYFHEKVKWVLAAAFSFLLVLATFFKPEFSENETVYLIMPRKLIDPSFLINDWTWSKHPPFHFVFECFMSLFAFFLSDLGLAMAGRLIVWFLLIGSMVRLAKVLRLTAVEFLLGFAAWFYAGQTLAAGEWIFCGVEAKCFSYAFLFMALSYLLENRLIKAAVFSGLAFSFHILVGGWGALGIFFSIIATARRKGPREIGLFLPVFFFFALPALVTTASSFLTFGAMSPEHYATQVYFRVPQHLDPRTFLTAASALKITILYFATMILMRKVFDERPARILQIFLTTMMVVFVTGLIAREFDWLALLNLYPFRLGPLILLLLFSFSITRFLRLHLRNPKINIRLVCLAALFFLGIQVSILRLPWNIFKSLRGVIFSWGCHISHITYDPFLQMGEWINSHTPAESVMIAPPWEDCFWILARRAQVVSFKTAHFSNDSNRDWLTRLIDLNRGILFKNRGNGVIKELKKNYPELSETELGDLAMKYHARYYLSPRARPNLPFLLVHANTSYYLYDLKSRKGLELNKGGQDDHDL